MDQARDGGFGKAGAFREIGIGEYAFALAKGAQNVEAAGQGGDKVAVFTWGSVDRGLGEIVNELKPFSRTRRPFLAKIGR